MVQSLAGRSGGHPVSLPPKPQTELKRFVGDGTQSRVRQITLEGRREPSSEGRGERTQMETLSVCHVQTRAFLVSLNFTATQWARAASCVSQVPAGHAILAETSKGLFFLPSYGQLGGTPTPVYSHLEPQSMTLWNQGLCKSD